MRTLIYKTEPDHEGIDNTQEVVMNDNISWEIRFYCDICEDELCESQVSLHKCKDV